MNNFHIYLKENRLQFSRILVFRSEFKVCIEKLQFNKECVKINLFHFKFRNCKRIQCII